MGFSGIDDRDEAFELFREGYELQKIGELDEAVECYSRSIDLYPTAEAYTYRGWTYSSLGRLDDAIEEDLVQRRMARAQQIGLLIRREVIQVHDKIPAVQPAEVQRVGTAGVEARITAESERVSTSN